MGAGPEPAALLTTPATAAAAGHPGAFGPTRQLRQRRTGARVLVSAGLALGLAFAATACGSTTDDASASGSPSGSASASASVSGSPAASGSPSASASASVSASASASAPASVSASAAPTASTSAKPSPTASKSETLAARCGQVAKVQIAYGALATADIAKVGPAAVTALAAKYVAELAAMPSDAGIATELSAARKAAADMQAALAKVAGKSPATAAEQLGDDALAAVTASGASLLERATVGCT